MSENSPNGHKDDEIDLLDLFRRLSAAIGRFFTALGKAIVASVVFLLKNWLPLILSIIAGIGLSFLSKSVFRPVYRGDMVLKTNVLPPSELLDFVNSLHTYCREENVSKLSSTLGISPETAARITDIRAFWVIDNNNDDVPDYVDYSNKHNVYDSVNVRMTDRLAVRIKTASPADFVPIRAGLLRFINTDSLHLERNRVRLLQNQELLVRLAYDIKQLDSLQKVKYFEETRNRIPATGGQTVFLQEQKTQLVYSDIYELYTRKQLLETQQVLYKDVVSIISDITIPLRPVTGALYYGIYIIPSIFLLTLIVLIILKNSRNLKEVYKSY
jgi:hypothetical protein